MDQNSGSTKGVIWIIVVIVVIIIAGYLIYKYSAIRPAPQTSPTIPTQNQVPPTHTSGATPSSQNGNGAVQAPPAGGGNGGAGITGAATVPTGVDVTGGTQGASYPAAAPAPTPAPIQ